MHKYLFIFLIIGAISCSTDSTAPSESGGTLFELISSENSSITYNNRIQENQAINIYKYGYLYNGGGVGIGDINNDGLPDVYLSSTMGSDKLYLNKGKFQFEDISTNAGIEDYTGHKTGVNFIDINNDGWLDIYICRSGWTESENDLSNLLFINNRDNTFAERAKEYGINDPSYSVQSVFFDMDNDGDNDLYVSNHPKQFKQPLTTMIDRINEPAFEDSDKLYRNDNGKFVDVSKSSGILNYGYGLGIAAADFNDDGLIDLYVSNDFAPHDYFYINQGNGKFKESLKEYFPHCSYFSMGSDVVDINNDGHMDLFVVEMLAEDNLRQKTNMAPMDMKRFDYMVSQDLHYQYMRNVFQINNGNGYFSDVAYYAGIDKTDWSWGALFGDYDQDGDNDLLVANGYLNDTQDKDFSKKSNELAAKYNNQLSFQQVQSLLESTPLTNYAFRYDGNYKFEKVAQEWGFDFSGYSNGLAYGDLDQDGDLDVIVNNINDEASVYRNTIDTDNYVSFTLIGPQENLMGLNSRVSLFYNDDKIQNKEYQVSRGFQSSCEPKIHFGLPQNARLDSVKIRWSNGTVNLFTEVQKGTDNILKYNSESELDTKLQNKSMLFTENNTACKFNHTEIDYDDYAREVLLPHKLSQLGPALASGDVNGDDLDDFYIGGAHQAPGSLWIQTENGQFNCKPLEVFESDKEYEDVSALFMDVENDGDLDLIIGSGSNEFETSLGLYRDRLYINDGQGDFKQATNTLPKEQLSTGCIVSGDYDNDGYSDLFIGGRLVPGQYPNPASSKIYKNINGRFVDDSENHDKSLKSLGMITSATWVDYDKDQDLDLVVIGEWTDIIFFENNDGKLSKVNKISSPLTGWWNSIKSEDLDQDGNVDFILGNLGMNYKYQASAEKPFEVFSADFDQNGSQDIVLSYYNEETLYPVRGFQCSSEQIPDLKKKFDSYESFGSADVFNVYGGELSSALHYQANQFGSGILWGNSDGSFTFDLLPAEVQLSPIQDILISDFNGDNKKDLLLAGNWFVAEIETPRADAGTGVYLVNKGNRQFEVKSSFESGFFANRDVRNMALLRSKDGLKVVVANNNSGLQIFEVTP